MAQIGKITSEEDFSSLLGALYSSATDIRHTPEFLSHLAVACGAHSSAIHIIDSRHGHREVMIGVGVVTAGSEQLRKYNDLHAADNVWVHRGAHLLAKRGMISGSEIIAPSELKGTPFYNECLVELDVLDTYGLLLWEGGDGNLAMLSVDRSERQGTFGPAERSLFNRLMPHARNAYVIQRRLSWAVSEASNLLRALDHLHFGVVLLDRSANVDVVNAKASSLLHGTVDAGRRLGAGDGFDQRSWQQLNDAIAACLGPAQDCPQRVALKNASGEIELIAVVAPLPALAFAEVGHSAARVVVFLHPLRGTVRADEREKLLVQLYGLSPAQARLARLLCTGMDLQACADALGIRPHTVKSQLKTIYRKTDTHRQAELVAVVGRIFSIE